MNKNDAIIVTIGIVVMVVVIGLLVFVVEKQKVDIRQTFLECVEKTDDATWCYDKL